MNGIVSFLMKRGSIWRSAGECFVVALVSFLLAFSRLWIWGQSRHFGQDGRLIELSGIKTAYVEVIAFVYGPLAQVVHPAFDRLPVMGWAISFASLLVTITIQNLLLWFLGKWAFSFWRKGR